MKTGDLVKWKMKQDDFWLAVVVEEPIEDSDKALVLIRWVTGRYIGEEDFIAVKNLEVIG